MEVIHTQKDLTSLTNNLEARLGFSLKERFDAQHELRTQLLLIENMDLFKGKRVLDIGAGHGLFSLVAACLGAERVVAYDGRPAHQDQFQSNLRFLDPDFARRISYEIGLFDDISKRFSAGEFDTLIFAGGFYHISNHVDLLRCLYKLGFQNMIIDTSVTGYLSEIPIIRLSTESCSSKWNGMESQAEEILVGMPNRLGLKTMIEHCNWKILKTIDFRNHMIDGPSETLRTGRRVAHVCQRK